MLFAIPSSPRAATLPEEAEEASDTNMTTDGTFPRLHAG